MPKPFMKPWSRWKSTVGCVRAEVEEGDLGVLAALSPSVPLAHSPISSPALKLSVAKVASAASIGSSGVSSAITRRPASRAFLIVGTIALESLGVIRKPFAPAEIRLSIAATWPSLSPSYLPAKRLQLDAELLGLGLGAFLHLHEERVGVGLGDQADLDGVAATAAAALPIRCRRSSLPQAAMPAARASADPTVTTHATGLRIDFIAPPSPLPRAWRPRQRFQDGVLARHARLVKQLRKRILSRCPA